MNNSITFKKSNLKIIHQLIQFLSDNTLYIKRSKRAITLLYSICLILCPNIVYAAGSPGTVNLLKLAQEFSFWLGILVCAWGIVEWQLQLPGWKKRLISGIGGYVAVLLLPIFFLTLKNNLQIDVWNELNGGTE